MHLHSCIFLVKNKLELLIEFIQINFILYKMGLWLFIKINTELKCLSMREMLSFHYIGMTFSADEKRRCLLLFTCVKKKLLFAYFKLSLELHILKLLSFFDVVISILYFKINIICNIFFSHTQMDTVCK